MVSEVDTTLLLESGTYNLKYKPVELADIGENIPLNFKIKFVALLELTVNYINLFDKNTHAVAIFVDGDPIVAKLQVGLEEIEFQTANSLGKITHNLSLVERVLTTT